jgi:hypothetical protein
MPAFKSACSFAVSQGWLIVVDDTLTLTTAAAGRVSSRAAGASVVLAATDE